ncbi:hypothetical protein ACOSP7_008649 [Xanthoceras sorbifolium]
MDDNTFGFPEMLEETVNYNFTEGTSDAEEDVLQILQKITKASGSSGIGVPLRGEDVAKCQVQTPLATHLGQGAASTPEPGVVRA